MGRRWGKTAFAAVVMAACGTAQAQMRITEYLYSGTPGEFVEFTNVGASAVDMTGWSFDDDSRTAGTMDVSAFGVVNPGESVILTEAAANDFRASWRLCDRVKVIGGLSANLGRNDEINLFDAADTLVDRLTYGDQDVPGTIRAQDVSGIVSAAGLGADNAGEWTLSADGDAEGTWTAESGNIASPGRSTHGAGANPCGVRITEFMYSGSDDEFIEFTNLGPLPTDLAGWSFDDDSRTAGTVDLSAFGTVAVGESVILAEASATDFRTAWGLCPTAKVVGGLSANLGRNDEINLFDAADALIDRLTYGDEDFPGTIRTQDASGWVNATGVGADAIAQWTLSALADAEDSASSSGGDVGSPARSARAPTSFDACASAPGTPTIAVAATTTPRLHLPTDGSGAIAAVLGDPTDPARTLGVDVQLSDDDTNLSALTVTATSSDPTVIAEAGLALTGSDGTRHLTFTPAGVGSAIVTVTVDDGDGHASSYTIDYRVAAASINPTDTRFHADAADASASVAVDAHWMFIANDEDQVLRLYPRSDSGYPQTRLPFSDETAPDGGPLGLTDASGGGTIREVDIEAAARIGDRIYWLGAHAHDKDGDEAPNRRRLFATAISGSGASSTLGFVARYDHLREDLVNWDAANGHGLGANALGLAASTATGVIPETADGSGFNIEGMVATPDGQGVFLGFRAPLQDTSTRNRALIVPVNGIASLVGQDSAGAASFGDPILMDLGGRAIRDMARNAAGDYLILAGPAAAATGVPPADFRLFHWSGDAADAPELLPGDLTALQARGSFEGIVEVPAVLSGPVDIQLIVDNGDTDWYDDGTAAKDLANPEHQLFRSEWVSVTFPVQDGDDVPEATEDGVPGLNGADPGDGNGDGIADSLQGHVASLPASVGGCYFTVAVAEGLALHNVTAEASPGDAPTEADFPCGVVGFTAPELTPGETIAVTVIAHGLAQTDARYLKRTATGGWAEPQTTASVQGAATVFTFSLVEGGDFDADGQTDGQLTDPGGPATLSVATAIPTVQPWGLVLMGAVLAMVGLSRRR